jgi:hypothetical protein
VRTTIDIDPGLLAKAKNLAKDRNCSLGWILNEALQAGLFPPAAETKNRPIAPLKTFRGDGCRPGVDLRDNAELFELMEEP